VCGKKTLMNIALKVKDNKKEFLVVIYLDRSLYAEVLKVYNTSDVVYNWKTFEEVEQVSHYFIYCLYEKKNGYFVKLFSERIKLEKEEITVEKKINGFDLKLSIFIDKKYVRINNVDEIANHFIIERQRQKIIAGTPGKYLAESKDFLFDRRSSILSNFVLSKTEATRFPCEEFFQKSLDNLKKFFVQMEITFDKQLHWYEVILYVFRRFYNYVEDSIDEHIPPFFHGTGDCEDFVIAAIQFKKLFDLQDFADKGLQEIQEVSNTFFFAYALCSLKNGDEHVCLWAIPKNLDKKKIVVIETTDITVNYYTKFKRFDVWILKNLRNQYAGLRTLRSNYPNTFYDRFLQLYTDEFVDKRISGFNIMSMNGNYSITFDEFYFREFKLEQQKQFDDDYIKLTKFDSRFKRIPELCYKIVEIGKKRIDTQKINKNNDDIAYVGWFSSEDIVMHEIQQGLKFLQGLGYVFSIEKEVYSDYYEFYKCTIYKKK